MTCRTSMKKIILTWCWYLILSNSSWALTPSESLIEGHDLNLLGGMQIGHESAIHHSTHPTDPDLTEEENALEGMMNTIKTYGTKSKCVKHILYERVKALEIFSPLHESNNNIKPPLRTLVSKVTHQFSFFTRWAYEDEVLDLAKRAQRYNSRITPIARELEVMIFYYLFGLPLFNKCVRFEIVIMAAVECLQRGDLTIYERLWTLHVLRRLHVLSPILHFEPIAQDPKTGRVCRGGLELFLTQGMDTRPRVKGISNGRIEIQPVDECVTEALNRVELILNIKNYLQGGEKNLQTPTLIRIHDTLLQNRSLSEAGIIEFLTLQAIHHKIGQTTPDGEIQCLYHILRHLEKFYPITKQMAIEEALKRVELSLRIRKYLRQSEKTVQTPILTKIHDRLLHTKSLANTWSIRSLAVQCMQHILKYMN
ncbi:hypothetical protein DFH28DRAFT_218091 [Melampsora americana]|nr:hypothetical protein DFH28DRAFT_218091 [Melampsora americana]